jgi:hypothetical protein
MTRAYWAVLVVVALALAVDTYAAVTYLLRTICR